MHNNELTYQKKDLPASLSKIGMVLLIVGIILGVTAFFVDHSRAVFNYLIAFTFLISIGVGALFLIALEYIVGADWSVPYPKSCRIFCSNNSFACIIGYPTFI